MTTFLRSGQVVRESLSEDTTTTLSVAGTARETLSTRQDATTLLLIGQAARESLSQDVPGSFMRVGQTVRECLRTTSFVPSVLAMDNLTCAYQPAYQVPSVSLRWSDTAGASWNNRIEQSIGNTGQYDTDVSFRRLGISRERVFELSWSGNMATALNGAFIVYEIEGT